MKATIEPAATAAAAAVVERGEATNNRGELPDRIILPCYLLGRMEYRQCSVDIPLGNILQMSS